MVNGVSFSNFNAGFGQNVQQQQGTPGQAPKDFLNKLKSAGIPDSVISQGKDAVVAYAKANNITLPQPPAHTEGAKGHAKGKKADAGSATSDDIKSAMDESGIPSSGKLQDDIASIQAAIKSADDESAVALKEKFGALGVPVEAPDKNQEFKDAFKGSDNLASLNKHLLVNGKSSTKTSL